MTAEHVRLGLPEPELGKVLIGAYIDPPDRDSDDGRGESRAIGWKPVPSSELAGGGGGGGGVGAPGNALNTINASGLLNVSADTSDVFADVLKVAVPDDATMYVAHVRVRLPMNETDSGRISAYVIENADHWNQFWGDGTSDYPTGNAQTAEVQSQTTTSEAGGFTTTLTLLVAGGWNIVLLLNSGVGYAERVILTPIA